MNTPIGRFRSCRPARDRRMALATLFNAASWPTTRLASSSSIRTSFWISLSSILVTGMPVHLATIFATSSSSTCSFSIRSFC